MLFLLVLLLPGVLPARASFYADSLHDVRISLLKDTVIQSGTALAFNSLTLENFASSKKVLTVELDLPPGWSSPFQSSRMVVLEPHAVLRLPVRTAASHATLSNVAYPVTLKFGMPGSNARVLKTYIARVAPNPRWEATLVEPELKLDRYSRITYFMVRISNTGNVDEELSMDLRTGLELSVPAKNNRIRVRAASDTIVHVGILTEPRLLDGFKAQRIFVDIRSKGSPVPKVLVQNVFSNYSTFRENSSRWFNVPMYVELVSQNFTVPGQKQFYLNSAGSIALDPKMAIDYAFRSENYYNYDSEIYSRYAHVDFATPKWKFSVGDQVEFSQFPIDGLGARISHTTRSGYSFDVLGVNSRLGDARQLSLTQSIPVAGRSSLTSTTLLNLDREAQTNSYSTLGNFSAVAGRSSFEVSAGYGFEKTDGLQTGGMKGGPAVGLTYYFNSPNLVVRSVNRLTSPNFSGLERGVRRSSSEVRLIAGSFFMGALGEYSSRSVRFVDSLRLISLFGGRISEYGLRGGFFRGRQNISLTASVVDQLQDSSTSIPYRSKKLGLNAGLLLFSKVNVSVSGHYAASRPNDQSGARPVHAFSGYATLQSSGMGFSFRADHGPFYYWDLMQYRNTGAYTSRYQFAPFAERSFFRSAFTSRLEVNYLKDATRNGHTLAARVDLNLDLKKRGMSVRFYGNHRFSGDRSPDYLNLSIRKNLNMPLVGVRRYKDLKIVLFKDMNNNSVFDSGDVPIPEASVLISGQRFTSDAKGTVTYRNISSGAYTLDLRQDDNVRGWIARNGFRQQLNLDRSQTWYIPFKESRFISGRVDVVKDGFSKLPFSPAGIRISAISSKGESYSTLTNAEGQFFLNLPADSYLLQINKKVFSEEFRILQDSFRVDLTAGNSEDVVFEVREKKRAINIRKAD